MQIPASKTDALYLRMRADICMLGLAPDEALRLPALSERYGIGLTPIRECLNRLSAEKWVVPVHNKGFKVASLSLPELLDLEKSRSVIEGALFAEAMTEGDDAWEALVVGTFHHLSKMPAPSLLLAPEELGHWTRYHTSFHEALTSAAQTVWLQHFYQHLSLQLGRYQLFIQNGLRRLARSHPDRAGAADAAFSQAMSFASHQMLYDVAMARDVAAARDAFTDHSNLSIRAFESLIEFLPPESPVLTLLRPSVREAHP